MCKIKELKTYMAFLFDTPEKIKSFCDNTYNQQTQKNENNIKLKDLYYNMVEGPRQEYNMLYEQYLEDYKNTNNLYDKMALKYPELPKYYNLYTYTDMEKR